MNGGENHTTFKTPSSGADGSEGDDREFATFENPRIESVTFHLVNHWRDLRIVGVGERSAETHDVVVSCERCEVRYLLEDLPAERVPGTEAFENLSS
ncbi:hypothetical protein NGM10_14290 [Halorussus salilacus]|uniref:hypothetical protein n=1 Tax=Halorussus salilacus TaxID=2953750 RepID=UPI0020A08EDD|nr:hypothetical protein [Halorussus salilacus]USZ67889.1 hypothetical protein NGM10_14290 [Halorussus salilacus]